MNERIQELVEQAIVDVDVVYEDNPLNEELAKMYIPVSFAEMFAELIVRECADIADINSHQYELPGFYIRKHFGVK